MPRKIAKKRKLFLGVDPGQKGYLCVIDEHGRIQAMVHIPYLGEEVDVARLMRILKTLRLHGVCYAILESQQAFHREGPAGAFTNGFGYGALKASLIWSGIPFEVSRPTDWKRSMNIPAPQGSKPTLPPKPAVKNKKRQSAWKKECNRINARAAAERKKKRKDLACRRAQQLQPEYDFRTSEAWNAKVSDGKCEAYLIAELARRTITATAA